MTDILFKSVGKLHYSDNYSLRVIIDAEIVRYYRSLIPKSITIQPQKYAPHISVVRKEIPPVLEMWSKYQDKEIEFFYSPIIYSGTVYHWLNIFSIELEKIRLELGLPVSSQYTLPPEGFIKCFHTTLGNSK